MRTPYTKYTYSPSHEKKKKDKREREHSENECDEISFFLVRKPRCFFWLFSHISHVHMTLYDADYDADYDAKL